MRAASEGGRRHNPAAYASELPLPGSSSGAAAAPTSKAVAGLCTALAAARMCCRTETIVGCARVSASVPRHAPQAVTLWAQAPAGMQPHRSRRPAWHAPGDEQVLTAPTGLLTYTAHGHDARTIKKFQNSKNKWTF